MVLGCLSERLHVRRSTLVHGLRFIGKDASHAENTARSLPLWAKKTLNCKYAPLSEGPRPKPSLPPRDGRVLPMHESHRTGQQVAEGFMA